MVCSFQSAVLLVLFKAGNKRLDFVPKAVTIDVKEKTYFQTIEASTKLNCIEWLVHSTFYGEKFCYFLLCGNSAGRNENMQMLVNQTVVMYKCTSIVTTLAHR